MRLFFISCHSANKPNRVRRDAAESNARDSAVRVQLMHLSPRINRDQRCRSTPSNNWFARQNIYYFIASHTRRSHSAALLQLDHTTNHRRARGLDQRALKRNPARRASPGFVASPSMRPPVGSPTARRDACPCAHGRPSPRRPGGACANSLARTACEEYLAFPPSTADGEHE